jgi:hypothetical protein
MNHLIDYDTNDQSSNQHNTMITVDLRVLHLFVGEQNLNCMALSYDLNCVLHLLMYDEIEYHVIDTLVIVILFVIVIDTLFVIDLKLLLLGLNEYFFVHLIDLKVKFFSISFYVVSFVQFLYFLLSMKKE